MRLDPLSIPFRAAETVYRLLGVLIVLVIGGAAGFAGAAGIGVLVVGAFVLALGYQLVYYQRFEYELTDDTLDIASGVVSRRDREIPVRRVQNVDITRNVVQRALDIAQIDLETAGGSSTEASLRYVDIEEARRLQSEIGRLKRGETPSEAETSEPERQLFEITPKELTLLGVVGVDLRLLSGLTVLLPVVVPRLRGPETDPLFWLLTTAPLAAVAVFAVAAAVSGALAVTNYYGFRLTRGADELHYERGLLQRFSGTIPLDKVQTLTVSENALARRLGYASLAVETAGYGPGDSGSESAIPLAERDRVFDLGQSVESFRDTDFTRPPKRARERYVFRYGAVALGLVGVAFAVERFSSLEFAWQATVALLALAPVGAHLKWRNLGYDVQEEYVVLREGFWNRTITVVPYYRVQTVVDSQTVFQRRRRLATLVVDTAGSSGLTNRQPRALDIDAEVASELREAVADRLQTALTRRRDRRARDRLRAIDADSLDGATGPAD